MFQAEDEVAAAVGWESVSETTWDEADIWAEADDTEADLTDYPVIPDRCPVCDNPTQYDPADPSVGIMNGAVYCEVCTWDMGVF